MAYQGRGEVLVYLGVLGQFQPASDLVAFDRHVNVGLHTSTKPGASWSVSVADASNPATLAIMAGFEVVNGAAATFGVTLPTQITAGVAFSSKVTVTDAWGNGVQNYFGTVHFATSAALAGLPADYTFTGADAGTRNFTLALDTSGGQTVSVADDNNPLLTGTASGTVRSAAASSIVVAGGTTTTAGAADPFTVTALDAFGNVATGYSGTVTFSSSDVQSGLPASYTFTNKDAGTHTFTATLKTAGTQSLTVKDSAANFVASQTGIAVSAGAAAQFVISASTSVTQGVGFKFTMTVLDAYGNVVTGYRGKVHLRSTDPKGGTSDYTFSNSDNGVHVFSYTFNTLGLETLKFVDTTNSSVTGSAVVNVIPK